MCLVCVGLWIFFRGETVGKVLPMLKWCGNKKVRAHFVTILFFVSDLIPSISCVVRSWHGIYQSQSACVTSYNSTAIFVTNGDIAVYSSHSKILHFESACTWEDLWAQNVGKWMFGGASDGLRSSWWNVPFLKKKSHTASPVHMEFACNKARFNRGVGFVARVLRVVVQCTSVKLYEGCFCARGFHLGLFGEFNWTTAKRKSLSLCERAWTDTTRIQDIRSLL